MASRLDEVAFLVLNMARRRQAPPWPCRDRLSLSFSRPWKSSSCWSSQASGDRDHSAQRQPFTSSMALSPLSLSSTNPRPTTLATRRPAPCITSGLLRVISRAISITPSVGN